MGFIRRLQNVVVLSDDCYLNLIRDLPFKPLDPPQNCVIDFEILCCHVFTVMNDYNLVHGNYLSLKNCI